jgi:trk system potassium uptake protein TrkA
MNRKKIAVIGLGEFGLILVKCLHREGHEVIAIDKSMDLIDDIADHCTTAVCLDSTDEKAMHSQGLEEMDAVILASADNLEMMVVTIDILKKIGVKEIVARYKNELQIRILNMFGITKTFNPEERAALNMAEQFSHHSMRMSTILTDEYRIAEIDVPPIFVGKSLSESHLKEEYRLNIVTIKRRDPRNLSREEIIGIPISSTVLQKNDILILFGKHDDIDRFLVLTE